MVGSYAKCRFAGNFGVGNNEHIPIHKLMV